MKILHVVGARPNFMKTAPLMRAMRPSFEQVLVHTGQHYDANMSQIFFQELDLPRPDVDLGVGSGSHAQQTARVMLAFEPVVQRHQPDWVFVVGDVNSTLACTLVCSKLGIRVAHVEAGLRSFDRTMPEEINRVLTDQLADLLFTPSVDGDENLQREGITPERINCVGNIMIDTLVHLLPKAADRWQALQAQFSPPYGLVTLHRPANVDDETRLLRIMQQLALISAQMPIFFPVHPRTRQQLLAAAWQAPATLHLLEPLGYLDFLALQQHAAFILTDSGGVQEEATYLGVPCLTLRPNTERPITLTAGTNQLVKLENEGLIQAFQNLQARPAPQKAPPPLWDGHTAERIVQVMEALHG